MHKVVACIYKINKIIIFILKISMEIPTCAHNIYKFISLFRKTKMQYIYLSLIMTWPINQAIE